MSGRGFPLIAESLLAFVRGILLFENCFLLPVESLRDDVGRLPVFAKGREDEAETLDFPLIGRGDARDGRSGIGGDFAGTGDGLAGVARSLLIGSPVAGTTLAA